MTLNFLIFPNFLRSFLFSNFWSNSYAKLFISDIQFHFACDELKCYNRDYCPLENSLNFNVCVTKLKNISDILWILTLGWETVSLILLTIETKMFPYILFTNASRTSSALATVKGDFTTSPRAHIERFVNTSFSLSTGTWNYEWQGQHYAH